MIPRRVVEVVLARDHGQCVIAGPGCLGAASVADHRANRGMGGAKALDVPVNLIAACGLCNGAKENAKGTDLEVLRNRGVRVLRAATVAATLDRCAISPVMYPDGSWWLLDHAGGREEANVVQGR